MEFQNVEEQLAALEEELYSFVPAIRDAPSLFHRLVVHEFGDQTNQGRTDLLPIAMPRRPRFRAPNEPNLQKELRQMAALNEFDRESVPPNAFYMGYDREMDHYRQFLPFCFLARRLPISHTFIATPRRISLCVEHFESTDRRFGQGEEVFVQSTIRIDPDDSLSVSTASTRITRLEQIIQSAVHYALSEEHMSPNPPPYPVVMHARPELGAVLFLSSTLFDFETPCRNTMEAVTSFDHTLFQCPMNSDSAFCTLHSKLQTALLVESNPSFASFMFLGEFVTCENLDPFPASSLGLVLYSLPATFGSFYVEPSLSASRHVQSESVDDVMSRYVAAVMVAHYSDTSCVTRPMVERYIGLKGFVLVSTAMKTVAFSTKHGTFDETTEIFSKTDRGKCNEELRRFAADAFFAHNQEVVMSSYTKWKKRTLWTDTGMSPTPTLAAYCKPLKVARTTIAENMVHLFQGKNARVTTMLHAIMNSLQLRVSNADMWHESACTSYDTFCIRLLKTARIDLCALAAGPGRMFLRESPVEMQDVATGSNSVGETLFLPLFFGRYLVDTHEYDDFIERTNSAHCRVYNVDSSDSYMSELFYRVHHYSVTALLEGQNKNKTFKRFKFFQYLSKSLMMPALSYGECRRQIKIACILASCQRFFKNRCVACPRDARCVLDGRLSAAVSDGDMDSDVDDMNRFFPPLSTSLTDRVMSKTDLLLHTSNVRARRRIVVLPNGSLLFQVYFVSTVPDGLPPRLTSTAEDMPSAVDQFYIRQNTRFSGLSLVHWKLMIESEIFTTAMIQGSDTEGELRRLRAEYLKSFLTIHGLKVLEIRRQVDNVDPNVARIEEVLESMPCIDSLNVSQVIDIIGDKLHISASKVSVSLRNDAIVTTCLHGVPVITSMLYQLKMRAQVVDMINHPSFDSSFEDSDSDNDSKKC